MGGVCAKYADITPSAKEQGNLNPFDEQRSAASKQPLSPEDHFLGVQSLAVLSYCYWIEDKEDSVKNNNEKERAWEAALGIENKTLWRRPNKPLLCWMEKRDVTSFVLTGTIKNISATHSQPIPFICFRGTTSIADIVNDIKIITKVEHKTPKGNKIGIVGKGIRDYVHANLKPNPTMRKAEASCGKDIFDEVRVLMEAYPTGLLVIGHSLGGGACALFMAEFARDYPDLLSKCQSNPDNFGVHCVSFGAPRVFGYNTSNEIENFRTNGGDSKPPLYRLMRFTNHDDVISASPQHKRNYYFHVGTPIFAPEGSTEWHLFSDSSFRNFAVDIISSFKEDLKDFLDHGGSSHRIVTPDGYTGKLLDSDVFKSAFNNLASGDFRSAIKQRALLLEKDMDKLILDLATSAKLIEQNEFGNISPKKPITGTTSIKSIDSGNSSPKKLNTGTTSTKSIEQSISGNRSPDKPQAVDEVNGLKEN